LAVGHTWAMTEREAEALRERLERVWKAEHSFEMKEELLGNYAFSGRLSPQCVLFAKYLPTRIEFALHHVRPHGSKPALSLRSNMQECSIVWASFNNKAFVEEHLPRFRRGIWLMGLPIEASAHEKAEWLQGFTREEIEAWNLKI
jgi:hypothetical protein